MVPLLDVGHLWSNIRRALHGTPVVRRVRANMIGGGPRQCVLMVFTPARERGRKSCPVWFCDAARFGLAIAAAVNDPEAFD